MVDRDEPPSSGLAKPTSWGGKGEVGPPAEGLREQAARKRSLAHHRKTVIQPQVAFALDSAPSNPPLPWAWIAFNADDTFPSSAFALWWQVRALGKAYPATPCPWCEPTTTVTRAHLEQDCPTFAQVCWTTGIRPEEAFAYPSEPTWFIACLNAVHTIQAAQG